MAKVLILGAGISGHTCAAHIRRKLSKKHEVTVVSPSAYYQWVPSNIWVGIGQMTVDQVKFKLAPLYKRWGIKFEQAKAVAVHPEGGELNEKPFVSIEYTDPLKKGETAIIEYDYLVNATGPKLNFEASEGLGPGKNSYSVCSYDHAAETWEALKECLARMAKGEKLKLIIGTGHPAATCQGAAFEYALNVAFDKSENDIGSKLFAPNGFMKVDADYYGKPFEE
jgi:sulfide:quinone oxidoreductase